MLRLALSVMGLHVFLGPAMTSFGQETPTEKRILVLGAGMSGISAAKTLHEAGYTNFEIIEGADRIGGRIKESQLGGFTVENGPIWIYGKGSNPVWTLAQNYNISAVSDDLASWKVFDENGEDVTEAADALYETSLGDGYSVMDPISKQARQEDQADFSIRAAYIQEGWIPKTALDDAVEYNIFDWEFGTRPEVISTKYGYFTETFTAHGNDEIMIVKDERGFSEIVKRMASEFLSENDPRLHLKETVTDIESSEDAVTVRTTRANYTCDYVIVTFSLGVLQHRQVSFNPQLPDWKLDSIDHFTFGTVEQIYFQFPNKFWSDENYFVYADEKRGYFNTWLNLDALIPGSRILMVTAVENEARRLVRMTDTEVIDEAIAVLQKMFKNAIVPNPSDFLFHRWTSDPLFFGSYSDWPVGYDIERYRGLNAPVGRIYFAGEYTTDEHYSFMHGAYYSGQNTTNRLISCITNPSTCINFTPAPPKVLGCTYVVAKNFDREATVDDGSCVFDVKTSHGDHNKAAVGFIALLILSLIFC